LQDGRIAELQNVKATKVLPAIPSCNPAILQSCH
jgi:hypothetical protein